MVVTAISGSGGVGKSWLALRWAHDNAERFPDGQLYANLRGFDTAGDPLAPADVISQFLEAFEPLSELIPSSLDTQAARYRSLLAGRRMLIVLDNARDSEQVLPLLPGSSDCLVLVTSRSQLSGLVAGHDVTLVSLDTLSEPEAMSLLARRLGQDRVAAEQAAAADMIEHCARLPLALGIAAARATANPGFSLQVLAEELSGEHERLDVLAADDPASDVRAVFSWSYQALGGRAARLFRLLGLHPGPDIAPHAAASLARLDLAETRTLLAELARAHLLEEHVPGRYTSHDLLRAYAAERAAAEDPGERRAAINRTLDHYLHTGFAAERQLAPHWEPIEPPESQPGVAIIEISDYARAMRWFTAERANLIIAIDLAARTGFDTHAWQLPWALSTFLTRQGFRRLRATTQQTALAAAGRLGEADAQACSHHLLGRGHVILEEFDEGVEHLQAALRHYDELGDRTGQATVHFSLAQVGLARECPAEALDHSGVALELYRATGNQVWEAFSRSVLGGSEALLGKYRQSIADSHAALTLLRTLGNQDGQAHALRSLGYAYLHLGEHAEAVGHFREGVALFRALGDNYHEANTLRMLGDAHQAGGDQGAAMTAWQRAVAIFDELVHPDADTVRAKLSDVASG